jgi:hypothetical protein
LSGTLCGKNTAIGGERDLRFVSLVLELGLRLKS